MNSREPYPLKMPSALRFTAHLVHLHEKNSQDRVILPSFGGLQHGEVA
jgi:hypothetical protein